MKQQLQALVEAALIALRDEGSFALEAIPAVAIERCRDRAHGDFATPIALGLARTLKRKPREIAETIVSRIPSSESVDRIEIAGPGFVNFFLTSTAQQSVISQILAAAEQYGCSQVGQGRRVLLEFVSANPTGPLHVGHGRHAAFGAVVAKLLAAIGFEVECEFYINDAGRQMDILATSVWLRYLEICGKTVVFPANGYRGEYIKDMARELAAQHGQALEENAHEVFSDLPPDEADDGDKEVYVDALITRTKSLLGETRYGIVFQEARDAMVEEMRHELEQFGVTFDRWSSESDFVRSGAVESAVAKLRDSKWTYEHEGALWFKSSELGDEKDRVLIRENGQATYFTPDFAYHMEKSTAVMTSSSIYGARITMVT